MKLLMGEYNHSLDEKNRLIVPSKFRDCLGTGCVITKGLENTLFVYSVDEFEKITKQLNNMPFVKKDARSFSRFFLSGATYLEFDKQGRVVIPSNLTDYASLTKECVIIGVGNRIEIWDKDNWNKFNCENDEKMTDIAENLICFELGDFDAL